MARAYGDDLRRKLLEAHAAGNGTLVELAERFGVSVGYTWKVSAALKRTKSMARVVQVRRGAVSKVDEDALRALVKRQPDLILRELQPDVQGRDAGKHRALGACVEAAGSQNESIHATKRDSGQNRQRRTEFVATLRQIAPERLIYLDESGRLDPDDPHLHAASASRTRCPEGIGRCLPSRARSAIMACSRP